VQHAGINFLRAATLGALYGSEYIEGYYKLKTPASRAVVGI